MSVLVKGITSGGKSKLVRTILRLMPPEDVTSLTSLSKMAPVYGQGTLDGKILYVAEYRGGRDAQYLIRLQQSEGEIRHEYATVRGSRRSTKTSERVGCPVVLTTTTDEKVFDDDETRFLSIWIDESPTQTLGILKSLLNPSTANEADLPDWQETIRILCRHVPKFRLPDWFNFIMERLPRNQIRVRRDAQRFLTFCEAIALVRRFATHEERAQEIEIRFSDYCVAYRLLNSAFASTAHAVHESERAVFEAVRSLTAQLKKPVSLQEVADHLGWGYPLLYKYFTRCRDHKLLDYLPGKQKSNLKLVQSVEGADTDFLPSPLTVFASNEVIGQSAEFVDPVTGKLRRFERQQKGAKKLGLRTQSQTRETTGAASQTRQGMSRSNGLQV